MKKHNDKRGENASIYQHTNLESHSNVLDKFRMENMDIIQNIMYFIEIAVAKLSLKD